jgi:hypothetical protein
MPIPLASDEHDAVPHSVAVELPGLQRICPEPVKHDVRFWHVATKWLDPFPHGACWAQQT